MDAYIFVLVQAIIFLSLMIAIALLFAILLFIVLYVIGSIIKVHEKRT